MNPDQLSSISGMLLMDKSYGMTSATVVNVAKRKTGARKVGHTGALDPLATGLLPICLNDGTKFSQFLLDADKRYTVRAKLGQQTATGDAEGEVVGQAAIPTYDPQKFSQVLTQFHGEIEQIPPRYSAIKYKGKPLYRYARSGKDITPPKRVVSIHEINLLEYVGNEFALDVHVSKGTYIRTLVEDIAQAFGTLAFVSELRRTAVGPFTLTSALDLDDLEEVVQGQKELGEAFQDLNQMLFQLPSFLVNRQEGLYLANGQWVKRDHEEEQKLVKLLTESGEFLGMGELSERQLVKPLKMVRNPTELVSFY